jgi:hypothetical protein
VRTDKPFPGTEPCYQEEKWNYEKYGKRFLSQTPLKWEVRKQPILPPDGLDEVVIRRK